MALEPLHGYGVGLKIEQISTGVFRTNAGSLVPAFRRLERQALIKGEWRETENNRHAKYYILSEESRKKLETEARKWQTQSVAIARIPEATSGEL